MLSEKQQEQVIYLIFNHLGMPPFPASEVGLPREKWSNDNLTSRAVWCGPTGKGILFRSDHAENGGIARESVIRNLACSWLWEQS
jgi:hypothetical protein